MYRVWKVEMCKGKIERSEISTVKRGNIEQEINFKVILKNT
jgi:hypothetical protein